jgi:hypothetical protein
MRQKLPSVSDLAAVAKATTQALSRTQSQCIEVELRVKCDRSSVENTIKDAQSVELIHAISLIDSDSYTIKNIDYVVPSQKSDQGSTKITTIYTKNSVASTTFMFSGRKYKLNVAEELPVSKQKQIHFYRVKTRFRVKLNSLPGWYCDVTFVHESDPAAMINVDVIKKIASSMHIGCAGRSSIEALLSAMDVLLQLPNVRLELEFECCTENLPALSSTEYIRSVIDKITTLIEGPSVITDLNDIFSSDKATIKDVLPPVIELNKSIYKQHLFGKQDSFFISDKADGVRCVLICTGTELHTGNEILNLESEAWDTRQFDIFVAEAEECDSNGSSSFYLYDLIRIGANTVIHLPFKERLALLKTLRLPPCCRVKPIVPCSSSEIADALQRTGAFQQPYTSDGIIYTSANDDYRHSKVFKWKPIELMSVDFIIRVMDGRRLSQHIEMSSNSKVYMLTCGIKAREARLMGLKVLRKDSEYVSIMFAPADNQNAFIYVSEDDINGKVGEFTWRDGKWHLLRLRHDRENDVRHGYKGNNYFVAEMIWRNFANPLTRQHLLDEAFLLEDAYFKEYEESPEWRRLRTINNRVKASALHQVYQECKVDTVIDLGAGKGQDFHKYIALDIRTVIAVELNEDNICEMIERRRHLVKRGKPLALRIVKHDCTAPADALFVKLHSQLLSASVPLVVCQFAFHYFCANKAHVSNAIEFMTRAVQRKGYIILTVLDGNAIHSLLSGDRDAIEFGSAFRIEKRYRVKRMGWGLKIGVKVPFASHLYEEHLVDIKKLEALMKTHRCKLMSTANFVEAYNLAQEKGGDSISANVLEYMKLHRVLIFVKD